MKHKLLQTWARKSAKLLAAIALLATTAGAAWAQTATLKIEKTDVQTGNTSTSYVETEFEFTAKNNKFKTNNINPDKFQVRGNNKDLAKDFYLFNTTKFGVIKEIKLTATDKNLVPSKINLFISDKAYNAAPTGNATTTGGSVNSKATNVATLTVPDGTTGEYFYLQFTKGSTSGNCYLSMIEIIYATTPVSTELGEVMYGDEAANGQSETAYNGDVFTFTADNADSMSIKVGTEENPSITSDTNSISWTAETPVEDNTTYNLTISATKGTETKTATFTVVVKKAPLCTMPPVFTPGVGTITKGSTVTITCENAKQIKYWISENADDAEADAQTVDAPAKVTINQNCYLHACGINADGIAGETSSVQYTVTEPTTAEFDFTNAESINAAEGSTGLEASNSQDDPDKNNLDGKSLTKNGITLSFSVGTNTNNEPRWWKKTTNQGGGTELRIYTGNTLTVTAENGKKLSKITMNGKVAMNASAGTIINGVWTPSASVQTIARAEGDITSVVLTPTSTCNISSIAVDYATSTPTGIAGIEAENGEAVYFNLQGVRVQNPENGIFIRVQNGKATKIMK